jgi:hypothetical protein
VSRQYWVAPVGPLGTSDGTALATSTTLTDISAAPQITIPANTLEVGSELEIMGQGQFSTTGTPTLLLGFYFGGVAGVALAATAATTTGTTAAAWPFMMRYRGIVRAIGTAGSIKGVGVVYLGTSLTAYTMLAMPATAAARTVAIDTTAAKAITIGAQWGTSSASNTITAYDISVKLVT